MSPSDLSGYSKYLRVAHRYVQKSNHDDFQLVAIILDGSKVISIGWNKDHLHAEHIALNRAWRSDLRGCTALVFRFRPNGVRGMAMPCKTCRARLARAGIRKAIYTNRVGGFDEVLLEDPDPKLPLLYHFTQPRTATRN